jgi:hypothetical protein
VSKITYNLSQRNNEQNTWWKKVFMKMDKTPICADPTHRETKGKELMAWIQVLTLETDELEKKIIFFKN